MSQVRELTQALVGQRLKRQQLLRGQPLALGEQAALGLGKQGVGSSQTAEAS